MAGSFATIYGGRNRNSLESAEAHSGYWREQASHAHTPPLLKGGAECSVIQQMPTRSVAL